MRDNIESIKAKPKPIKFDLDKVKISRERKRKGQNSYTSDQLREIARSMGIKCRGKNKSEIIDMLILACG